MESRVGYSILNYPSIRGAALDLSVHYQFALRSKLAAHRYHAVQEFNRGVFDYLIATDESGLEGHDRDTNVPEVDESSGPTRELVLCFH